MNRRSFIRSVSGLLALATVPAVARPVAAPVFDALSVAKRTSDNIYLLEDLQFNLKGPVVIDLQDAGIIINRCIFRYVGEPAALAGRTLVTILNTKQQVVITNNVFDSNGANTDVALSFTAQPSGTRIRTRRTPAGLRWDDA